MTGLASLLLHVALAAAPVPPADTVRVECEGTVRYEAGPGGRTRLVLTGGVSVTRGATVLRARAAKAVIADGGGGPDLVRAEGDVVLESPAFSARADRAEMRKVVAAPEGDGKAKAAPRKDAPPLHEIRLDRRELAEVELRAGDVLVACRGPLTYSSASREARLTGGVRAESPKLRARCREARVVFLKSRPLTPAKNATDSEGPEKRPALPGVASVELAGDVVLDTPGKGDAAPRRVRAARAFYNADEDTIAFTGKPAPVVEYGGVTLTAPEIVLHLGENRIEPRGGKMRAVLGPAK